MVIWAWPSRSRGSDSRAIARGALNLVDRLEMLARSQGPLSRPRYPHPDRRDKMVAAVQTYEAEFASALDAVLGRAEQQQLHDLITRLPNASSGDQEEPS